MRDSFAERYGIFAATPGTVDWHQHVWPRADDTLDEERMHTMMRDSALMGVERAVVSMPVITGNSGPERTRLFNNHVAAAVRAYPGRLFGLCYVNPGDIAFALEEIDRCVTGLGFVGIKLYNQYHVCDAAVRPVLQRAAALDVPVLQHAGKLNMYADSQPCISDGTHFAQAAEENPDTRLILAHIGGGGDWQWQIRAIEPYPNVFVDISGSIHDEGMLEFAAQYLGAQRVLFGTDGFFASSLGKLCGCGLGVAEKRAILEGRAFERYLEREVAP